MTSRELAERAMRGEQADRVPVAPLVDTSYAAACYGVPVSECLRDPRTHAKALVRVIERHPDIDGVSINIGLTREVISNQRAADVLRPHIVETLRAIPEQVRRRYDISAGLTGPFSQITFLMGVERVLLAMHEEPDALKKAIDKRVPLALAWVEELAALDAPSVWIGEGVASSSLISPRQYEEFVLPYEQPVAARFAGRMSIKGNLHTTALVQNSPQEVFDAACAAIEKTSRGGGFILSSGCALGRDTPPENIDAMVRAAISAGPSR